MDNKSPLGESVKPLSCFYFIFKDVQKRSKDWKNVFNLMKWSVDPPSIYGYRL